MRLARAYPREAAIAAGTLVFSAAAMASVVHLAPPHDPLTKPAVTNFAAPPSAPENAVQNVAPDKAVAINHTIPLTGAAGPAAPPFVLASVSSAARNSALNCLAQAVYYEAGNESEDGQRGVAQVVLNRVRHPAFPASVCGVVYQGSTKPTGCQFTFTCDGSLLRRPDSVGWDRARRIAADALGGRVAASVGYATHYHADYVLPTWAHTLAKTDVIGAHLFYRWNGGWGQPGAFVQRYSGSELDADSLRSAALSAHAKYIAAGMPTAGHPASSLAQARAEGLAVTKQADGRVSMHFSPKARAAVEAALAKPADAQAADVGTLLDFGKSGTRPEAARLAADQEPLPDRQR